MIKLIATDMDGTLLRDDGKLPEGFYELFHRLEEKGVYFAIASGRQYYTLLDNMAPVKEKMAFIAENGAVVMHRGKELFSCAVDRQMVEGIIRDAREVENCDIVLCGKNGAYIETEKDVFGEEVKKYYHRRQSVQDLLAVRDDILKIAVYDYASSEENSYRELYPKWGRKVNVTVSGKHWLDLGRPDVNKGVGLRQIQKTLGISEGETMIFGDYFNDVPMMEAAYYSYAMKNAPEEVKRKARFEAPANEEEGVLEVIRKLEKEGLI